MRQLDLFYDKLPQYIITWDYRLNNHRRTYNVYDDWDGITVARFFENEDYYKDFWNRRKDWYEDHEIKYFHGTHQSAANYIKNVLGQRYRYV
jgi:hypothetical protein|tara:strand:- start:219 stop:494 length:276 start_codon:yes stop_codon:yes gene_type:complete